jgi:putative ABC transport system permease protein
MMKSVRFSMRNLKREWRSGELRALALAIIVAVTAVSSVGFFANRIQRGLEMQAGELLGADLVVASSNPIPDAWLAEAERQGLRTAQTLTFPSVVLAGDRTQLAAIKAVSRNYPLRGKLKVSNGPYAPGEVTEQLPAAGQVWLDSRLMSVLAIPIGGSVQVGSASFTAARVLTYEPDRGGDFFAIAPRLLMRLGDVPRTQLLQPGSRVKYRLLVAGQPGTLEKFRAWIKPRLTRGEELLGVDDARPELRTALDRGRRFLGLASLVSVLLAGVAVAISARRYADKHLDSSAIMRCLGAEQGFISRLYILQITWLGIGAGAVGCALGYGAQSGLAMILAGILGVALPSPSWLPALVGMLTGLVTLFGFALPPLMRLKRVPPVRVLRRDIGAMPPRLVTVYGSALAAIGALILWQAGELRLAIIFLLGILGTVLILGTCAWLLIRAVSGLRHRVGVAWRFGLANIARRASTSTVHVLGFGLGIMALLLLTLIRNDLLEDWRATLPPEAPNQFAINIQTDQLQPLRSFFQRQGLDKPVLYPMVRGRLIAVNNQPVGPERYENPRAKRLVTREFNLSWAGEPQSDNHVVAGHWWSATDANKHQLSVEQGIAETLGIRLGDRLTYRVAGEDIQATVTSLRSVAWDTFRPNFFVLSPPGLLDSYPATWISSFYLPGTNKDFLSELVREFPNVTVIDVEAVMSQVRTIMDRVALAVEYVFVFTLLAGLVVLYAAIRRQLLLGIIGEFLSLGLLAGLLGALGATTAGYFIAEHVLDLSFQIRPYWWLLGTLGGGLGIGLAGLLGTRSVLRQPPMQTLRQT